MEKSDTRMGESNALWGKKLREETTCPDVSAGCCLKRRLSCPSRSTSLTAQECITWKYLSGSDFPSAGRR